MSEAPVMIADAKVILGMTENPGNLGWNDMVCFSNVVFNAEMPLSFNNFLLLKKTNEGQWYPCPKSFQNKVDLAVLIL